MVGDKQNATRALNSFYTGAYKGMIDAKGEQVSLLAVYLLSLGILLTYVRSFVA